MIICRLIRPTAQQPSATTEKKRSGTKDLHQSDPGEGVSGSEPGGIESWTGLRRSGNRSEIYFRTPIPVPLGSKAKHNFFHHTGEINEMANSLFIITGGGIDTG